LIIILSCTSLLLIVAKDLEFINFVVQHFNYLISLKLRLK